MHPILIRSVRKTWPDGRRALDDLTLEVRPGEIFGFLGPNGAGKTTTIKMLLGFLAPDEGAVRVFGRDPRESAVRARLGFMPETAAYYGFLNVRELLRFYGRICGLSGTELAERIEDLIRRVGLQEAGSRPLKTFSKGMLQRAGLAQALLHEPDLLVLDEPLTGLDPLARIQLRDLLREFRERGKTVFFSSHELSEAEMICDRVGILREGRLVWCGDRRDVTGDGSANLERVFLKWIGGEAAGEAFRG